MAKNAYLYDMANTANERGRDFAKLVREARTNLKMTQDEVVARSGISKSTLIRWEGGRAERPDPDQVRELCKTLRIDPSEAAIALGYLQREDLGPPNAGRSLNPSILEVIEILEDPRVPDTEKQQWVGYLRYLRDQVRTNGDRGRHAS